MFFSSVVFLRGHDHVFNLALWNGVVWIDDDKNVPELDLHNLFERERENESKVKNCLRVMYCCKIYA